MSSTYIPADVKRDLWVASGGRCEFRGCNAPLDRNFLTGQRVVLAEHCHIVGDSINGPRGDAERSAELAKAASNLILCCARCHKTIDTGKLAGEYPEARLLGMKQEHEQHVQRLYDATNVKRSIPFIVTGRINRTPTAIQADIARAAILRKADYTRFPSHEEEVLDLNLIRYAEDHPLYWATVKQEIDDMLNAFLRRVTDRHIQHLDLFALAQIPALAYIGSLIGDRVPVTVHQPQREPLDRWTWPVNPAMPAPAFSFSFPDQCPTDELAVSFSISGAIKAADVERTLPNVPMATFSVENPSTSVVDCEAVQQGFVKAWREFQTELHQRYGRLAKLHIFPALPVSLAVELGRCTLPKVIPQLHMWDFVKGDFVPAFFW